MIRAATPKPKQVFGDEMYIDQVLNNRFKVESKIGEGGFGAVYRGTQLATNRKVALKLLHPEMTKDENLVARFRREGMVLCATCATRTPSRPTTSTRRPTARSTSRWSCSRQEPPPGVPRASSAQWKRMFKILIEMCSSLAEAHSQGIVHRDLKPENIYLETRPGNPEFVKILDFGIAKVMRGDSIDPQSPQLTATGQTLGTLHYMSPEQLMGKQLDGRSDVYALGVVAYEMITARLPFPDAKGPAGLITAQLKQTPQPPSAAYPKAALPQAADRVILKALEKDKNNRHADVTAMANALQEVLDHAREASNPLAQPLPSNSSGRLTPSPEMLETRKGDLGSHPAPPAMPTDPPLRQTGAAPMHVKINTPAPAPQAQAQTSYPQMQQAPMQMSYPQASQYPQPTRASSSKWVWWVVGLLALGAAAGAVLALAMRLIV